MNEIHFFVSMLPMRHLDLSIAASASVLTCELPIIESMLMLRARVYHMYSSLHLVLTDRQTDQL